MTPELWQRIKTVLEEVDAASAADRVRILARIATTDPELRREVEPYLSEDSEATFIQGVINEQAASLGQVTARQERFGHYQLVRRIGQGGMGAVFEAVRVDDFHKKVALKIIKQGLDSDFARTRFLQERQTLASLEHPYIARLLDGGETDDGSPYLVLEFVDGEAITHYSEKLDRRGRLHLFLKVCEAVEHAHRNLVVHRDLKPANILVTADGEPKLLDFGIAKLLDPTGSNTQTGFAALTPEYASPEQVRGESITTASDVYSLGVILYQMLTGRKPYTLETATVIEMDRIICQQPPAAPGLGDELDHILLMALRKEPARRYGGVQRFAEDIQRYLDNRPVSARPDTMGYRAKKFVQRNRWAIAAAVAIGVSLTAGIVVAKQQERRAELQAQRAERSFFQARKLANTFLLEFDAKLRIQSGTTDAREFLVKTVLEYLDNISHEGSEDPDLKFELARAYDAVGTIQGLPGSPNLGHPQAAIASYERSVVLFREALGSSEDPEKLRLFAMGHSHLGRLAAMEGDAKKAEENFIKGLAVAEKISNAKDKEGWRLKAQINIYTYFADLKAAIGQPAAALELQRKSLAGASEQNRLHPSDRAARDVVVVMARVGDAERLAGDLEVSGKTLSEVETFARGYRKESPGNVLYSSFLASVRSTQCLLYFGSNAKNTGNQKAAIEACADSVECFRKIEETDNKSIGYKSDLVEALIQLADVQIGMDNKGAAANIDEAQRRLALLPATVTNIAQNHKTLNEVRKKLDQQK